MTGRQTRALTDDVRNTLAAVLASLEADEASERAEEAVLARAASAEAAGLVVLAFGALFRARRGAHRVCRGNSGRQRRPRPPSCIQLC